MIIAAVLARSGEGWKSGPMGLAVILLLCVACYFLFKSMSKHMRKVREEFPSESPAPAAQSEAVPAAKSEAVPAAHSEAVPDKDAHA